MARFKIFLASREPKLHLICGEGDQAFAALPQCIRTLGPWRGGDEGEVDDLAPHYRTLFDEQGFIVLYVRSDHLKPRG